jgi:hypothetical protein
MPEPELFLLFVRPLNRAGIRYVVSGSVAAIFYGEPRLTHDVDFVVFLNADDIQKLIKVFPAKDFYLPPLETMVVETGREHSGHFNLIHLDTGFKADLLPVLFIPDEFFDQKANLRSRGNFCRHAQANIVGGAANEQLVIARRDNVLLLRYVPIPKPFRRNVHDDLCRLSRHQMNSRKTTER